MKYVNLPIAGAYLLEVEPVEDERGLFTRTFCRDELAALGIDFTPVQCSTSFNRKRGTLRGMHLQRAPFEEIKLVRCTQGRIYDVIVDLRPGSPTYRRWEARELSAENRRSVLIPQGIAHGFQTLEDNSEIFYQMSAIYSAGHGDGARWNDPALAIQWPIQSPSISARDAAFLDLGNRFG